MASEPRVPDRARILLAAALANGFEFLVRSLAPLPYAPSIEDVALSFLRYGLMAVPALATSFLGPRLRRFSGMLGALPFALLAAELVFILGNRSRLLLAAAALAGLALGALLVRFGGWRSLAVAGVLCFAGGIGSQAPERPAADATGVSVLLVVLDTTATGHLSAYGYGKPTTPALEALAHRSLLYRRAISPAPWTVPAHASIFSGLHPSELGFDGLEFAPIGGGSLATDLEATGRAAYGISANPLVPVDDRIVSGYRAVWRGDRLARPLLLEFLDRLRRDEEFLTRGQQITDLALDWLDRLAPRRAPWFLFLNYIDPHIPYRPPQRQQDEFAPGVDPSSVGNLTQLYASGRLALTPQVTTAMRALYDGEVAAMDEAFGRLIEGLAHRGYDAKNLLVVVTADHGEALGEHGLVGHLRGLPDQVLHVPLLISGPGVSPGEVATPVQTVQIRATVRALLGLSPLATIAPALPPWGRAPEFLITEHPEPRWYFEELRGFNEQYDPSQWLGNWVAIERDGEKVVFDDKGRGRTYRLREDPGENAPRPLAEGAALAQAYRAWHQREWATARAPSDAKRRVLESMGYVH